MKIALDFDDFSILNNRLDLLLRLRESYPKLKVSLFTIPYDMAYEKDVSARLLRDKTLAEVKKNLDWMELIPHGLIHFDREFEKCDYDGMKMAMKAIDETFKKDDLPYVKGFKAPYWLWNKDVVRALDDEGWWGAIDRNQDMVRTKRFYKYDYMIDEPYFLVKDLQVLKLHGHITNSSKNGIEKCYQFLFKMPTDAEFVYASDLVEE